MRKCFSAKEENQTICVGKFKKNNIKLKSACINCKYSEGYATPVSADSVANEVYKRILENRRKVPAEQAEVYIKQGYGFAGCFVGLIKGNKVYACSDCGCYKALYEVQKWEDDECVEKLDVCRRCNSTNVSLIPLRKATQLNNKYMSMLYEKGLEK